MGAVFSTLGKVAFNLALLVCILKAALLIKVLSIFPRFLLPTRIRQGLCLLILKLAFSIPLFFAPWIRRTPAPDFYDQWKQLLLNMDAAKQNAKESGAKYTPTFILGNHTSFMDTLLSVSEFPSSVLWHARTYASEHLFKMPVLSGILNAVGHFQVHFTGSKDGDFSVDREAMKIVESHVDEHLNQGGVLCFFPEGQMNKNPDELLPLRYGGLKKALQNDARLWSFVTHGCNTCWPRKGALGGAPSKIGYSLKPLAPKGARALLAELRAQGADEAKSDAQVLSEHLHGLMQNQYDVLRVKQSGKPEAKAQ